MEPFSPASVRRRLVLEASTPANKLGFSSGRWNAQTKSPLSLQLAGVAGATGPCFEDRASRFSDYTLVIEVRGVKRRGNILNWAGFAVILIAFVSYIPFFALFPSTRDVPWANYLLFLIGGALIAAGVGRAFRHPEHNRGKISGSILAALSALLFVFFVVGVTYYSKQIPSAETALGVSMKAPPFVLANTAGTEISSADLLRDHRGLVLVFYRGYW